MKCKSCNNIMQQNCVCSKSRSCCWCCWLRKGVVFSYTRYPVLEFTILLVINIQILFKLDINLGLPSSLTILKIHKFLKCFFYLARASASRCFHHVLYSCHLCSFAIVFVVVDGVVVFVLKSRCVAFLSAALQKFLIKLIQFFFFFIRPYKTMVRTVT